MNDLQEVPDMKTYTHYHTLGKVFAYPGPDYAAQVAETQRLLDQDYPEAAQVFSRFSQFVLTHSERECEEVFTKTFHIQAVCYLDLGYVLFGEDYKRGEFLVHMKEEQAKVQNDCGFELPDNLANVLELMSRTSDQEFLEELAVRVMLPALASMIAEFDEARIQLKEKVLKKLHHALIQQDLPCGNVYRDALATLQMVLSEDFKGIRFDDPHPQPSISGAFLKSCDSGCGPNPLHAPVKHDLSVGMI
jgi:nitrate reductase assembly molybdenum cofactor insertion protein NarJ